MLLFNINFDILNWLILNFTIIITRFLLSGTISIFVLRQTFLNPQEFLLCLIFRSLLLLERHLNILLCNIFQVVPWEIFLSILRTSLLFLRSCDFEFIFKLITECCNIWARWLLKILIFLVGYLGHLSLELFSFPFSVIELVQEPSTLTEIHMPSDCCTQAITDNTNVKESGTHCHSFRVETIAVIEFINLLFFW